MLSDIELENWEKIEKNLQKFQKFPENLPKSSKNSETIQKIFQNSNNTANWLLKSVKNPEEFSRSERSGNTVPKARFYKLPAPSFGCSGHPWGWALPHSFHLVQNFGFATVDTVL